MWTKSKDNKIKEIIKINTKKNIINNIPKANSKNDFSKKYIKNQRASNYFNINNIHNYNPKTIYDKEKITSGKTIPNYISIDYINKSLLLTAYENSILILFEALKLYMKNDLS